MILYLIKVCLVCYGLQVVGAICIFDPLRMKSNETFFAKKIMKSLQRTVITKYLCAAYKINGIEWVSGIKTISIAVKQTL